MTRNTRIIVVNHREIPAGLIVDEVLGFRRFAEGEFSGDAPPTVARCERYLAGAFRRGQRTVAGPESAQVLESPAFSEAAAMSRSRRVALTDSSAPREPGSTLLLILVRRCCLAVAAAWLWVVQSRPRRSHGAGRSALRPGASMPGRGGRRSAALSEFESAR